MRSAAAGMLALAACVPTVSLQLPDIPEDGSALLFYAPESEPVVVYAIAPGDDNAFTLPEDAHLELAVLEHDLDALMISKGRAELAGDVGRTLPRALAVWETNVFKDETAKWSARPSLSAMFAARKLPPFDYEKCAASGRCLSDPESEDNRTCSVCAPFDGPLPPEPPNLIALDPAAPCPRGWTLEETPIRRCVPPQLPEPDLCPNGQAQYYGEPGCGSFGGRTCPSGQFAENLPSSGVIYVGPDEEHKTIRSAIRSAAPSSTIAIAKGMYEEVLDELPSITLRGACAAETIIRTPTVAPYALWTEESVVVGDLQLSGGFTTAAVFNGGSLRFERADISGAIADTIGAEGRLAIVDSRVRGGGEGCVGVRAGGSLFAERSTFESCEGNGIWIDELGSTATVSQSIVRHVTGNASQPGLGIVSGGGSLVLRDVLIEHVEDIAIHAIGHTKFARLENVVVRNVLSRGGEETAGAFFVNQRTIVRGLSIENTLGRGIVVWTPTRADLDDVVIKNVREAADHLQGYGISISGRAEVIARRIRIEDMFRRGIIVTGTATVSLEDVYIARITAPSDRFGAGIIVTGTTSVRLERVRIEDSDTQGVLFQSRAHATSLSIDRVRTEGIKASDRDVAFDRVSISNAGRTGIELLDARGTVKNLSVIGGDENNYAGLLYDDLAELTISDFALRGIKGPAIYIRPARSGTPCPRCVTVSRGIIEGSTIGVHIGHGELPLRALMNEIQYLGNIDTFYVVE